jgi:endonuclease/exonuclease/phosphatase family metal-dependent hydrolase
VSLKVISLNLWLGGELFPAIIDFLHREDADVVALQEVYDGKDLKLADKYRSMEVLHDSLGYAYSDFAEAYKQSFVDGPEAKIGHGNAVLSKLPILERSLIYMSDPPDHTIDYQDIAEHWPIFPAPLQHVVLKSEAGPINVFNMHGVWDMDGDNYSPERQRMSDTILKQVSQKPRVILTGDSNAKASNQAMRNLEARLTPVFGRELVSTFNMRQKTNPGYGTAAVDLMYVSSEFKVLSRDCPDVDISDHRPLVVRLAIDED